MQNATTYESIDWELEAKRVVAAFAVEGDCYFARACDGGTEYRYLTDSSADDSEFVLQAWGWQMSFVYYPDAVYFYIGVEKERSRCDFIALHRNGTITLRNYAEHLQSNLAVGLFNLGLLTPEVEASLDSFKPFTALNKQDFTLEYEARLAGTWKNPLYEAMDWTSETKRIVAAFEVVEPCQFMYFGQRSSCHAIGRPIDHYEALRLKSGLYAEVDYEREVKYFSVSEIDKPKDVLKSCGIYIGWDGSNMTGSARLRATSEHSHLVNTLSKALFFLDLLSPEIEAALGTSVSAHERLAWELEYGERMKDL